MAGLVRPPTPSLATARGVLLCPTSGKSGGAKNPARRPVRDCIYVAQRKCRGPGKGGCIARSEMRTSARAESRFLQRARRCAWRLGRGSSKPLVSGIPHRLSRAVLEPGHERPVELELTPALGFEEAPHILSVSIGCGDLRSSRDPLAMPIEWRHVPPHSTRPCNAIPGGARLLPTLDKVHHR